MNYWKMLWADRLMNLVQLFFWPVYLLMSYWGNGFIPPEEDKFTLAEVAFITGIQVLTFYGLLFLIFKIAYAKRKGRWIGTTAAILSLLLPALLFLFYHALPQWFDLWVYRAEKVSALERIVFKIVQQYFHLGSLAGLFVYRYYSVSQEVLKREAIKQRHRYELRFLTTAIDPHLLNSMLTNVELELNLMKTKAADKLATVVRSFAKMMAYGLSYAKDAKLDAPLKKELQQAKRYIDAQCFRLSQQLPVYVQATGCVDAWTVPPVTLNTLLGDVFRFGETTDRARPVKLRIDATADKLQITCRNGIGHRKNGERGIGLGNKMLKRLLEMAYPNQVRYNAGTTVTNEYETSITITKQANAKL